MSNFLLLHQGVQADPLVLAPRVSPVCVCVGGWVGGCDNK